MTEPCDNCGCGLASESVDTEKVELDMEMDFSVMLRRYLEKNTKIDADDVIQRVEVCPEEIVAFIESDGNEGA